MSSKSLCLLIVAYCAILFQGEVAHAQAFSAEEFPHLDERPPSARPPNPNGSELQLAWQRYELEHAAHLEATRAARGYKQRSMRVGLTMMIMGFPISFATAFLSLLEVSAGHGDIDYNFVHALLITSAVGLAAGATGAGLLLHRSRTNPHVQARIDARDRAREAKREYEQVRRERRGTSALHLAPTLRLRGRATAVGLQLRWSM